MFYGSIYGSVMVGYGRSWTMVWYMFGTMVGKCSTPPNEIRQTRSAKRDPAKRGPPNEVRQTRFAQPRQTRSAKRGPPNEVRQTRSAKRDSAKRDSTHQSTSSYTTHLNIHHHKYTYINTHHHTSTTSTTSHTRHRTSLDSAPPRSPPNVLQMHRPTACKSKKSAPTTVQKKRATSFGEPRLADLVWRTSFSRPRLAGSCQTRSAKRGLRNEILRNEVAPPCAVGGPVSRISVQGNTVWVCEIQ